MEGGKGSLREGTGVKISTLWEVVDSLSDTSSSGPDRPLVPPALDPSTLRAPSVVSPLSFTPLPPLRDSRCGGSTTQRDSDSPSHRTSRRPSEQRCVVPLRERGWRTLLSVSYSVLPAPFPVHHNRTYPLVVGRLVSCLPIPGSANSSPLPIRPPLATHLTSTVRVLSPSPWPYLPARPQTGRQETWHGL